jgi:hypothetical protein
MKSFKSFLNESGRCWSGYKPVTGKKAFSKGSCKKEDVQYDVELYEIEEDIEFTHVIEMLDETGESFDLFLVAESDDDAEFQAHVIETAAWTKKEGKSESGGLNDKGIASYRKEHPGSKLQKAVTGKAEPGSKDAKRRKSFCARMSGMPGAMKKPNGEPTRKALSLRKWKC